MVHIGRLFCQHVVLFEVKGVNLPLESTTMVAFNPFNLFLLSFTVIEKMRCTECLNIKICECSVSNKINTSNLKPNGAEGRVTPRRYIWSYKAILLLWIANVGVRDMLQKRKCGQTHGGTAGPRLGDSTTPARPTTSFVRG